MQASRIVACPTSGCPDHSGSPANRLNSWTSCDKIQCPGYSRLQHFSLTCNDDASWRQWEGARASQPGSECVEAHGSTTAATRGEAAKLRLQFPSFPPIIRFQGRSVVEQSCCTATQVRRLERHRRGTAKPHMPCNHRDEIIFDVRTRGTM